MFERICSDNKLQQLHFDNSKSDKYPNYITSWVLPVLAGQEHIIFLIPPHKSQKWKMCKQEGYFSLLTPKLYL